MSPDDLQGEPWMHVYGQFAEHSPAYVVGTKSALEGLRDAITAALRTGEGTAKGVASDGEGFSLIVRCASLIAQIGEPEYLYQTAARIDREERRRARQIERAMARRRESENWSSSQ